MKKTLDELLAQVWDKLSPRTILELEDIGEVELRDADTLPQEILDLIVSPLTGMNASGNLQVAFDGQKTEVEKARMLFLEKYGNDPEGIDLSNPWERDTYKEDKEYKMWEHVRG